MKEEHRGYVNPSLATGEGVAASQAEAPWEGLKNESGLAGERRECSEVTLGSKGKSLYSKLKKAPHIGGERKSVPGKTNNKIKVPEKEVGSGESGAQSWRVLLTTLSI